MQSTILTLAYDVDGACTFHDDINDVWFNEVKSSVDIIDSHPDWRRWFLNKYPDVGPYMWTEESAGGSDNIYAKLY